MAYSFNSSNHYWWVLIHRFTIGLQPLPFRPCLSFLLVPMTGGKTSNPTGSKFSVVYENCRNEINDSSIQGDDDVSSDNFVFDNL
jgi:hypothetical protein